MRNGVTIATSTCVDIEETNNKYGDEILKLYEGFFCESLDFNPYTEFVLGMCEKRDKHKAEGKDL